MNIENFIELIEEEFEDVEKGKLKPETVFRDIFEWNSINALIIIALVKSEFGVKLTAADLKKSKTINDIFLSIKKKLP